MTLLQLQYFRALARTLHYTKTAAEMHISQPGLSYTISELEKELGAKLFYRDKKKVSLTSYGQHFLPYVEQALLLLEKGCHELDQMLEEEPQVVQLGYIHSLSASIIPSLIEGFYKDKANKRIRFRFVEAPSYDIFSQIYHGELDLGFSLHRGEWAQSIGVIRQPLYLAVPKGHPLAGRRSVSFQDFAAEPQIMLDRDTGLRAQLDEIFAKHGVVPNVVFETWEGNAALQYVGLKFGVSVLPHLPAMDPEKVDVIPIADGGKEFGRTIYLTYHKLHPMSPAAQLVRDYIIKAFGIVE